jgi:hypothetical protein
MRIVGANRSRIVWALLLVGFGAALAVAGPVGLGRLALDVLSHIYFLFLAAAAVSIFLTAMPRGTRIGPVVLIVAGSAAYVATHERSTGRSGWVLVGLLIVLVGGGLAMTARSGKSKNTRDFDPVRRSWAIGIHRVVDFHEDKWIPGYISVCVIATKVKVDLTVPAEARGKYVELSVACWGGCVEIVLPEHWPVVGGRLALTRAIHFSGRLDSEDTFSDPRDQSQYRRLGLVIEERHRLYPELKEPAVLVVHVMGLGGNVSLVGRA